MKAQVMGGTHFYLYLDIKERIELSHPKKEQIFEAELHDEDGKNLGKKVILELDKNNFSEEYKEVECTPPNSSWEELEIIKVKIGTDYYNKLSLNRSTIIRDGIKSYQIEELDSLEGIL